MTKRTIDRFGSWGTTIAHQKWPRIQVYTDRVKKWRWRALARNGNVLADSGQGYSTKGNCSSAATSLFNYSIGVYNWDNKNKEWY